MKLSYFGYTLADSAGQKQYLFDIRRFMKSFITHADTSFKSRFVHADEHIYLLPFRGDLFLFIMTRENEVIKKIQSSDLSVAQLREFLEEGETLGFTSYIYFDEYFLAFASTLMAPKAKTFANFMNDLFDAVKISDYRFVLHPFMQQTSEEEVMTFPFIGRSSIVVNKYNNVFDEVRKLFSIEDHDLVDIDSFELIIRPKRQKNINEAIKKIIRKTGQEGVDKFILRAKEELDGHVMDLYLVGQGQISDDLSGVPEEGIVQKIQGFIRSNPVLREKVREHVGNGRFTNKKIEVFSRFDSADAWRVPLGGV